MSQDEIKDVLETLNLEPKAETEPAPEPTPQAEPPSSDAPPAETPATPPPSPEPVEPPKVESQPTPPEPSAVVPTSAPTADPRDAEIEALRAQVIELSKRVAVAPIPTPPAAELPQAPAPQAATTQGPTETSAAPIMFFKNEEEVDAALRDAGSFNAFLNRFYQTIREQMANEIINKAVERTTQIVPEVSAQVSANQVSMLSSIKAWYDANPDLLPFREFCGVIAKEVAARNPNLTIEKALEETEKEVRSRLRLVKPSSVQPPVNAGAPASSPGFTPGGRSGASAQPPIVDKVIQDIHNTIFD